MALSQACTLVGVDSLMIFAYLRTCNDRASTHLKVISSYLPNQTDIKLMKFSDAGLALGLLMIQINLLKLSLKVRVPAG